MNEILSEGLVMMCIGMGTVLCFLCILIVSMNIMSICVAQLNKWFPVKEAAISGNSKSVRSVTNNDETIAVAIAAAIAKN